MGELYLCRVALIRGCATLAQVHAYCGMVQSGQSLYKASGNLTCGVAQQVPTGRQYHLRKGNFRMEGMSETSAKELKVPYASTTWAPYFA